ncbi:hypothetical protein EYR40_009427 [Pleurotus pulmonarius]|nr:hypothetical protein EYR36_005199 [Pleurotus pulmonarius]KAF4590174.1 hypothetical protein EYR38_009472 [Pleurotus pulmonarius]KAF4590830.1 hypothetical protein EYR40_009427 [Pleurotus pulmonarius]
MNSPNDSRLRLPDDDPSAKPLFNGTPNGAQPGADVHNDRQDNSRPEFNLMVAGCRGGKTSFLRLLLDTSDIAQTASKDQLAAVAKFVQGCSGHTNHIRTASIDIDVNTELNDGFQQLTLSLIDTPSLDFRDEISSERLVVEMLRYIDSRFAEGFEDERKALTGDRYIHLCIYFLDPDDIVPPSVPGPPAPLVPRARTNSFSHQSDVEPVILEPPVTNLPLLCRPTLPPSDITTIRRLSARVNVLPVIAKADMLSNDRLAAIKLAIRRDLASAGIGFGIFDMDTPITNDDHLQSSSSSMKNEPNGYPGHPNGSASANITPPGSPVTPLLRLPYALISPDIYSHSDGVQRVAPSRHELVIQYTPSSAVPSAPKLPRGKYIRSYRWGSMDVLDPMHNDFVPLRAAVFHHMETLQKYTREYLFDKFRIDCQPLQRPTSQHSIQGTLTTPPHTISVLSHATRPILAIDTAPHPGRHPSLSMSRAPSLPSDMRGVPMSRGLPDLSAPPGSSRASGSAPKASSRQRTKKITVACNFCRSRKLKCDGGRPACGQCVKRNNPCDYQPQNKRRGNAKTSKPDESESDSADDRSPDEEPSLSPDVPSLSRSRRSSNVDKYPIENLPPPVLPVPDVSPSSLPPSSLPPSSVASSSRSKPLIPENRHLFADNELPHIATLLPEPPSAAPMSAPTLPIIRPASDQQAAQRKRSATVPGKTNRAPTTSGPKVVACNFCRARKTKCDGAHPACSSCARRQLPCNYVHDSAGGNGGRKGGRRASGASRGQPTSAPGSPPSAQSSRMAPTPADAYGQVRVDMDIDDHDLQSKRAMDVDEIERPSKKAKMDEDIPMTSGV